MTDFRESFDKDDSGSPRLTLKLTDKAYDASILSQNRRRRFRDGDVYQQIFDKILELACRKEPVAGKVLYMDSTHLKANASRNKSTWHGWQRSRSRT
jgi:hypothetical protein